MAKLHQPQDYDDYPFLRGGGEMGQLARTFDWKKTVLGSPDKWPQSLKTTLSIILNSKFPMFLWWGPELICFYNDAYRPSLGQNGKHPGILGMRGAEAWPEIWDIVKPLIDQVFAGEATWSEDQLIPIYRNGQIEDAYWTFGYSPVTDESDSIAGVLITCTETTGKIIAYRQLEENNAQLKLSIEAEARARKKIRANERNLKQIILQAPVAIAIFRGPNHIIEIANPSVLKLWGREAHEVLNKPMLQSRTELRSQGIKELLDAVYETGKPFFATDFPIQLPREGRLETVYVNFVYEPLYDQDRKIVGLITIGNDVTQQFLARKSIEESEERFRTMAEGSDIMIAVSDENGNATYFNNAWAKLTGRTMKKLLKFGWTDLMHPQDKERFLSVYLSAVEKRAPFTGEFRILSKNGEYRWLLAKGPPRFRPDGSFAGYIGSCIDITERKQAEVEKQNLTKIVEASTEFIGLAGKDTYVQFVNPAGLKKLGWDSCEGRKIMDCIYPDDRQFALEVMPERLEKGVFQHEIRFWNESTGEPFWIQWNGFTIKDADTGEVIGLATVSPDITERKKHHQELQAINEEMASANEELLSINEELAETERGLQQMVNSLAASESRFRFLVQGAPVAIAVLNGRELLIESANDMILKIWGKSQTILGKPLAVALPEFEGQFFLEILDDVYTSGAAYYGYEARAMLEHDGALQEFYIDFIYQPLPGADNITNTIMIVAIDVTDQVYSRMELKRTEEMLRFSVEAAGAATWHMDPVTRKFIVSDRLKELFGFHPDVNASYDNILEQIPENYYEVISTGIEKALGVSESYSMEHPITGYDGKKRWVKVLGKLYRATRNKSAHFSGLIIDITEQKQDDLRKNDFIGMVSHELKTPLTTLTALIQVLNSKLKNSEDTFISGALDKANIQAKRMSAMINGFLNISRLESGKILIIKQGFDPDQLIREMIEENKLTVSPHVINFKPCGSVKVDADRDKIGSVVSNLLSNAIKYSAKGSNIEIRCEKIGNDLQVSVKDEGIGISPLDIKKLFDRYYRVESKRTAHISGFGIGLYLSAEIISHHSGKIWVESEPGVGSTFYFSLPLI